MSIAFHEQVSAVSPLEGDAIDGTPQPKPKRIRQRRREPMDRHQTFFCRNANCDHATWSPIDQARHMHREFIWALEALVLRAPESQEALLLTGGVILAELTDDDCRAAHAEYAKLQRDGVPVLEIPNELRLRKSEYNRRLHAGILTPAIGHTRRAPLKETCSKGHELSGDNLVIWGENRCCRQCKRDQNQKGREERARLRGTKICEICEIEFTPKRSDAKICGSRRCLNRAQYLRARKNPKKVARDRARSARNRPKHPDHSGQDS